MDGHYLDAEFVADVDDLADWFVEHRLPDGGWNCEWETGSTRSSFHSTLNSVKGLLEFEIAGRGTEASHGARRSGEEYLLQRRLLHRLTTGRGVGPWVDNVTCPFRWCDSVLNAADYFRQAAQLDRIEPDIRLSEAIERIRPVRQADGMWLQGTPHRGRAWFDVDVPEGEPSKWLTLIGTRVLT